MNSFLLCLFAFVGSWAIAEENERKPGAEKSLAEQAAELDMTDTDAVRSFLDQVTAAAPAMAEKYDPADSEDLPETVRYSMKLARLINREDLASRYIQQLTDRLVSMDRMKEAEAFASEIPGYRLPITRAQIARAYALDGELEKAEVLLKQSEDRLNLWRPYSRELVVAERVGALAALGRFEEAEKGLASLTRRVPQAIAKSAIEVEKQRRGEEYTAEVEVDEVLTKKAYPERLKVAEGRMQVALEELSEATEAGEDKSEIQEEIQGALDLAFRANMDISEFLVDTADALREADEDEAADRLVNYVGWRISRLGSNAEWRNEIMARLASHYPEEKRQEVEKALEEALSGLSMFMPGEKAKAIASLGKAWAQIGNAGKAREMWLDALSEVRSSQVPRNWAMVGIDICLYVQDCGLEMDDSLRGEIEALLVDVPAAIRGGVTKDNETRAATPKPETVAR